MHRSYLGELVVHPEHVLVMASAEREVLEENIAGKARGLGKEVEALRGQIRAIGDLASVQEAQLDTLHAQALHNEDQAGQENSTSSAATFQQQLNATLSQLRITARDRNLDLERIKILNERLDKLDDAHAMRILNENRTLREQNLALIQRISRNDQLPVHVDSQGSTSPAQNNTENEIAKFTRIVSQLHDAWLGGRRERRSLRARLSQLEAQLRILHGHGVNVEELPGVQSAGDAVSAEEWALEMEMYRRHDAINHFFRHGSVAQDEDGDIQLEIKMKDDRIDIYRGLDETNAFFRQLASNTDVLAPSADAARRGIEDDLKASKRLHTHIYQTGSSTFVLHPELGSQSLPPVYHKKLKEGNSEQELRRIQSERNDATQARNEALHERDMTIMGRDQARAELERTPSPPDRQELPMGNPSQTLQTGSLPIDASTRDRSRSSGVLEHRLTRTQMGKDSPIQERDEAQQLLDSLTDADCPTRLVEARANLELVARQLNERILERDQVF